MTAFYRDKLVEAVRALADHGDLNMRLTYAAGCLLQIDNGDVLAGRLAAFERVRDPLIGQPMVAKGKMLPRSFDLASATAAAQRVVDLLAVEMARLWPPPPTSPFSATSPAAPTLARPRSASRSA